MKHSAGATVVVPQEGTACDHPYPAASTAWATVAVLFVLYWLAALDRQLVALLVTPIKQDLGLTDFQLSLLQGSAFALFFMIGMIPMGWLVDRYSRRKVIFWGVLGWSAAAMACGIARTMPQLFAARAAVGVGEGALSPAGYSILPDLFPPNRLAFGMSIFVMGAGIGAGFAFLAGGPILDWLTSLGPQNIPGIGVLQPWQMAFIVTGAPGFVLCFLIFLPPEPRRRHALNAVTRTGYRETLAFLWERRGFYLLVAIGFGLMNTAIIGVQMWLPTLLVRGANWSPGQIGVWLGTTQMLGAIVGMPLHGWIVDRLFTRWPDAHLRWAIAMCTIAAPCIVIACLVDDPHLTVALNGVFWLAIIPLMSVAATVLQLVTPAAYRGKVSSLYLTVITLLGSVAAPSMVAAVTDFVFGNEHMLHWSMALVAGGALGLAILLFSLACAPLRREMAASVSPA